MTEFETFEDLCYQFYTTTDPYTREKVDKQIQDISNDPINLQECEKVLSTTTSPYAQLMSLTVLRTLISAYQVSLDCKITRGLEETILKFLEENGQELPKEVLKMSNSVLSTILKFTWKGNRDHEKLLQRIATIFFGSSNQLIIGIELLISLIEVFTSPDLIVNNQICHNCNNDINSSNNSNSSNNNNSNSNSNINNKNNNNLNKGKNFETRVVLKSFRDEQLIEIFCLSLYLLNSLLTDSATSIDLSTQILIQPSKWIKTECLFECNLPKPDDPCSEYLACQAAKLLFTILTFDFEGYLRKDLLGDSDHLKLNIPQSWKDKFDWTKILELMFESLFHSCLNYESNYELINYLLQSISLFATMTSSVFNNRNHRVEFSRTILLGLIKMSECTFLQQDLEIFQNYCRCNYLVAFNVPFEILVETGMVGEWLNIVELIHQMVCTSNLDENNILFNDQQMHNIRQYLINIPFKIIKQIWQKNKSVKSVDQNLESLMVRFNSIHLESTILNFIGLPSEMEEIFYELSISKDTPIQNQIPFDLDAIKLLSCIDYGETIQFLFQIFNLIVNNLESDPNNVANYKQLSTLIIILSVIILPSKKKNDFLPTLISKPKMDYKLRMQLDAKITSSLINLISIFPNIIRNCQIPNQEKKKHAIEFVELAILRYFIILNHITVSSNTMQYKHYYESLFNLDNELNDYDSFILFFFSKIITNLKHYSNSQIIINYTLYFFQKFSQFDKTGFKLITYDELNPLYLNHDSQFFDFLDNFITHNSIRINYYKVITKLIFYEQNENLFVQKFQNFNQYFDTQFQMIENFLLENDQLNVQLNELRNGNGNRNNLLAKEINEKIENNNDNEELIFKIMGLIKDMRGIILTPMKEWKFLIFFDWFYPVKAEILLKLFSINFNNIKLSYNLLKFWSELSTKIITNTKQFQSNSNSNNNNNINNENEGKSTNLILFKLIINSISQFFLNINNFNNLQNEDFLKLQIKGTQISQNLIYKLLSGNCIDLGTFEAFQDETLNSTLQTLFDYTKFIKIKDIFKYPKLSLSYFKMYHIISKKIISFLVLLKKEDFSIFLNNIINSLQQHSNPEIIQLSCSIIFNIVSFYLNFYPNTNLLKSVKEKQLFNKLNKHIIRNNDLLQQVFNQLFSLLLINHKIKIFTLSQPILFLLFLSEDYYLNYLQQIFLKVNNTYHQEVETLFDIITKNMSNNTNSQNQSIFSKNLTVFRKELINIDCYYDIIHILEI
ncbi:exportin 7 [Anaeramoeba flamelloides]|uniref:Exportin 7 n=1 Tax=Anaeramoeba flamelloides TaxID=1746091 RepID=A0ABQ8Z742_9EUKA|nr:exportin 7 [Anaeramoeba flamelloides]